MIQVILTIMESSLIVAGISWKNQQAENTDLDRPTGSWLENRDSLRNLLSAGPLRRRSRWKPCKIKKGLPLFLYVSFQKYEELGG